MLDVKEDNRGTNWRNFSTVELSLYLKDRQKSLCWWTLLEQFYTFNCFKKHINNTQTTNPPTNQTKMVHTWSIWVVWRCHQSWVSPRAGLGALLTLFMLNPWLILGSHFSLRELVATLVVKVPVIIPSGPDSGGVSELLVRGGVPSARGCRASYIPWHGVTSKVKCEQALNVLVVPCNGEVVLKGSLQIVFQLGVKLPGLLLSRCSFHIQNCAPDGWRISWISTTDRGNTAQPRKQGKVRKTWIKVDSTAGSAWLGCSSARQPEYPIFIISLWYLPCFACVQVSQVKSVASTSLAMEAFCFVRDLMCFSSCEVLLWTNPQILSSTCEDEEGGRS